VVMDWFSWRGALHVQRVVIVGVHSYYTHK
jgi:hypothetical protein